MHSSVNMMVIQQHHAEIRREAAANRLARELRDSRRGQSRLVRDLAWELARYGGVFLKRLRLSDR